jgi:hypothetical protein
MNQKVLKGLSVFKYILIWVFMPLSVLSAGQSAKPIYFSDMSVCKPSEAFSAVMQQGKWQLISYESDEVSGKMAAAHSFINAPDFSIPLNLKGWYAIYLGYWDFEFACDGETVLKAKLSNAKAFRDFLASSSADTQDQTFLREVFMGCEDVTGLNLVIAKSNNLISRKLYFAYAKLVPLDSNQVKAIIADRADKSKRNVVATIDGSSFWHYYEVTKPEHVLEQVELYRNSDISKVLWAVNYGGTTNFRSSVKGAVFAGDPVRVQMAENAVLSNDYIRGEAQMTQSLAAFDAHGIIPQQVAAANVHEMGLKFDIMFRLGIIGGLPPWSWLSAGDSFVNTHPQFNQVMHDGTVVAKSSYAYPEVQSFMLGIIKDAIAKIDADGINLCFVRGPHLIQFEEPVASAYKKKYGKSIFDVPADDPNVLQCRAEFMTTFVRDVRKSLDQAGKAKNKKLTLSVWVWPSGKNVWLGGTPMEEGLDVKGWIKEGLLDSVICQSGIDPEYVRLCKEKKCEFILFTGYSGDEAMSPSSITKAYQGGVEQFAFWDIDSSQLNPESWQWMRRIGHRDEMAAWDSNTHRTRSIPLKSVNGRNLINTVAQQIYSGG